MFNDCIVPFAHWLYSLPCTLAHLSSHINLQMVDFDVWENNWKAYVLKVANEFIKRRPDDASNGDVSCTRPAVRADDHAAAQRKVRATRWGCLFVNSILLFANRHVLSANIGW